MSQPSTIKTLFEGLRVSLDVHSQNSLFADQRPVLIYGAGNVGKDILRILTERGIAVAGFLDRRATPGSAWMGVPIQTPDDPALSLSRRQQMHAVLGIFNAFVEIHPILILLKTLGYGRVTSFLDLHDHFSSDLGDRFWLTARSYYLEFEPAITACHELWSDDISRKLYEEMLRFRFLKDHEILGAPDRDAQYFPTQLPPWPAPLRFADCGAFDGDTLRQLSATKLPVQAIAAFEPDSANFGKLADYVRTNIREMPDLVALFPCGVDASTSQVRFSSGEGTSSHESPSGTTVIQCVSLDDALAAFRPNLIKMDIEGAEHAAIRGASRLIAEHRPGLAICLYHRPDHLWQVPLLVNQVVGSGGKYFLRCYGYNGFELVLYWLPN